MRRDAVVSGQRASIRRFGIGGGRRLEVLLAAVALRRTPYIEMMTRPRRRRCLTRCETSRVYAVMMARAKSAKRARQARSPSEVAPEARRRLGRARILLHSPLGLHTINPRVNHGTEYHAWYTSTNKRNRVPVTHSVATKTLRPRGEPRSPFPLPALDASLPHRAVTAYKTVHSTFTLTHAGETERELRRRVARAGSSD